MSKQSDIVNVSQGAAGDPLYIDSTNNRVGIGTSLPSRELDVAGNIKVGTGSTSGAWIYLQDNDSLVNGFFVGQNSAETANLWNSENTAMLFATNNTERMRIDASGNPMWGTTSVTSNDGGISAQIRGSALGTTSYFQFRRGTTTNNAGTVLAFFHGGTQVGGVSHTNTSTTYATSSDYRLKEDIQPIVGASDRVLSLNPCNFAWKDGGVRVDGFIAHEAQAVVPEAVHGTKDEVDEDGNPVYQGIDQSKLVPLLTAALQEALTEITALKDRVAALEAV